MKEGTACQAVDTITARGGILHCISAVTAQCVFSLVSERGIKNAELRLVENIESLRPELQIRRFPKRKTFQQSDIPIRALRIVQHISTGITECQSTRSREGSGSVQVFLKDGTSQFVLAYNDFDTLDETVKLFEEAREKLRACERAGRTP